MLADEQKLKDFLFKEADDKKEHRKKIAIHELLFAEVEDCQETLERLEKEAHARQSGGSNLKNSGWNTNWQFIDPSFEKVKNEVARKSSDLFANLRGQVDPNSFDLRPKPLSFYFRYNRTIVPNQNEEAEGKATNALNVLESVLPGFQQFQQEIESSNIPLNPHFMVSEFNGNDGRVNNSQLAGFISKQRGQQLTLPNGEPIQSASHYQEHSNQPAMTTKYKKAVQLFPMDKADTATADMLKEAIGDRIKDGYALKIKSDNPQEVALVNAFQKMYDARLQKNNIDTKNPEHGEKARIYAVYYKMLIENIDNWWQKDRSTKSLSPFNSFALRLILQNMIPVRTPKTPPDQFKASVRTPYLANGWDSSPDDPSQNMLTIPPVRQLPKGEIVYDRGNGNMGYDHLVLNWQNGLSQLFQDWGAQCDEWLKKLQGDPNVQRDMQQSPELMAAWQNVVSPQTGNRTGAEALLNLFQENPDWKSFNNNHLQKSLASEISTVNKLLKNEVASQSFDSNNIGQQLQKSIQDILMLGQTDPNSAYQLLIQLSSELAHHYKNGTIPDLDWRNLTRALHYLNTPIASAGMKYPEMEEVSVRGDPTRAVEKLKGLGLETQVLGDGFDPRDMVSTETKSVPTGKMTNVTNGLTAHPESRSQTMIDEAGYEILKQYGYQVAKIMDFLSATMYRSCHEQVGLENRYGHQYSTSSGISEGGEISLAVIYEQLVAKPSSDATNQMKVDVYEKLLFSLKQKSNSNEQPIILRESLPWEEMVDVFNEMYPEAGYEFDAVNSHISGYLDQLEDNVKAALTETKGDIQVVYHNSANEIDTLSSAKSMLDKLQNEEENDPVDELMNEKVQEIEQEEWTPETQGPEFPIPTPEAPAVPDTSNVPVTFTTNDDEIQDPMNTQNPMPKPMPILHDPASRSIQKKDTKKRRLLRQNAGLGSIEERLQKAANKLDECHEFKVADKIDLLLTKIHKEQNVRKTSNV